ncbi:hypothetical protein [Nocardiopsis sp. CC223A]|uniref:hypothetical protein n=1 Tax=Nocardiopsis sp. CC223A TaxID=3044051 RepID=UPI00278BFA88|nr:hypothetical protein [Nocardiopsis sp. CC223A]
MTAHGEAQFARFEAMDEEELYEELGRLLLGSGPGLAPDDDSEAADHGRRWFRAHYARLQRSVCLHPRVRPVLNDDPVNTVVDLGTIGTILSGDLVSDPTQAAVLAALITRLGLSTFCAGVRPDTDD